MTKSLQRDGKMKEVVKCVAIICAGVATCMAIMADPALAMICLPVFGVIAVLVSR